jgi:AAA ATPase domain
MDNIVDRQGFETRRPVGGVGFADRTEIMEQLGKLVEAHGQGQPSWVVLLGPRKVGKTSILKELRRRAPPGAGPTMLLDLFRVDARVQDIFTALLVQLLAAACEHLGQEDLAGQVRARPTALAGELAHRLSRTLPAAWAGRALELLTALRAGRVEASVVEETLGLPEQLAGEMGPVWVIIDELQELDALNRQYPFSKRHTVFRLMRAVWQEHEHVSYWATGSAVSLLGALFTDRRSPLHGHFRIVPVRPFAPTDAADLLVTRTRPDLRDPQERRAADLAVDALGGSPFYIQVLGEELDLRGLRLTSAAVKSVLQEILLSPSGRLALHLQGVLEADAGSGQQRAVLRALARGPASLAELTRASPSLTRAATHAMLRRLEATDLVLRNHETHRFRVADPALAAHLRSGGLTAEPPPSVLGEIGEREAAHHLMEQGLRPVYQSYRSLGPADLLLLEPGRRLAIQVKRAKLPLYFSETEHRRLQTWSDEQGLRPVLCQVDPDAPGTIRYWAWEQALPAGKRFKFTAEQSVSTALELLG